MTLWPVVACYWRLPADSGFGGSNRNRMFLETTCIVTKHNNPCLFVCVCIQYILQCVRRFIGVILWRRSWRGLASRSAWAGGKQLAVGILRQLLVAAVTETFQVFGLLAAAAGGGGE